MGMPVQCSKSACTPYSSFAFTVSVEKAVSKGNNNITVFCCRNSVTRDCCCEPWFTPTYIRSEDGGKTWGEAKELSAYKGRVYDAKYYKDSIYVLEFCNDAKEVFTGNKPEHLYRIFKSDDDGKTFYELCIVPFETTLDRAYGALQFTEEGKLIVYAYNSKDETHMDYIISCDNGKTWEKSGRCFFKEKIRNHSGLPKAKKKKRPRGSLFQ